MSVATGTLITAGIVGGAGLAGSAIAAHGAGKASDKQAQAAADAGAVQERIAQKNLDFQKQIYGDQQALAKPYVEAGTEALGKLKNFGEFQIPGADFMQDPGYQFRVKQGMQAIERSAAAKGNLLSGGTAKALERYGQDYASGEYNNVYNRRYQQYLDNYNRTANLAGVGATASQNLSGAGSQLGGRVGDILSNDANAQGAAINNAGAARASGYAAGGNIWGNTVSGFGNDLLSQYTLKNIWGRGAGVGGGGVGATPPFVPGTMPYQSSLIQGELIPPVG